MKESSEEVGVMDGNGQLDENVSISKIMLGEATLS